MGTQRFLPRLGKISGRCAFAILVGSWLALQFWLPSATFARSSGQTVTNSSPSLQDYLRDKVGVSVVRLVAHYVAADGTGASASAQCTGLGMLVASKQLAQNVYQNWVLADGNVIGEKVSQCGFTGGSIPLSDLQIWASTTYNNASGGFLLGELACLSPQSRLICNDKAGTLIPSAESVTTSPLINQNNQSAYTLFSFQSSVGEPYLTPPASQSTSLGTNNNEVRLTDQLGKIFTSTSGNEKSQDYLVPQAVSLASNAGSVLSPGGSTPTDEGGTPIVDNKGQLVGLVASTGSNVFTPLATPTLISGILARQGLPTQAPAAPKAQACTDGAHVASCWNAGIDAFYGAPNFGTPDRTLARSYLAALVPLNPQFMAPKNFEQRLPPSAPPPPSLSLSLFWQAVIGGGILLLLVLLLVLLVLLLRRTRKRQRELARFAAEQLEAQRIAEAEVQRQQLQKAQGEAQRQQVQQVAMSAREVTCPNCQQLVHLGDPMCAHCRFPLAPTASGLNMRLAGNAPVPPSAAFINEISEQPTLQFPPNPNGDAGETAARRQPSIAEAATVLDLPHPAADEETIPNPRLLHERNLSVAVGTLSDPGLKRKQKPNEDSLFAAQGARTHNSHPQQFGLFVVADGMGGHANGQDASRQAIQTMVDFMLPKVASGEQMDDTAFLKLMSDGVQSANQAVYNRNLEARADMGTTMTTALVAGTTAYVANVGDSRTYLYREGQGLVKVTNDHSVVASLVEAGLIKPDDIYTHPKRNQIYRSLGEKQVVEVDTFKVDLRPGDKLLLCSDGLWDMVRDPLIQQVLSKPTTDPNNTGQELIKAALEGGGEDNVSVIVAQFAEMNAPTGQTGVHLLVKPETVTVPDLPLI